jgi:hypothetical protein
VRCFALFVARPVGVGRRLDLDVAAFHGPIRGLDGEQVHLAHADLRTADREEPLPVEPLLDEFFR